MLDKDVIVKQQTVAYIARGQVGVLNNSVGDRLAYGSDIKNGQYRKT